MKILIPTSFNKNPYVYQLVNALQKKNNVEVVHTLVPWLFQDEYHFDIVHLQWPESIISKKNFNEENIAYLDNCLNRWKKRGTRIIATIHNEIPHLNKREVAHQIYSMIYEHCDGLLHMGEISKKIFHKNYQLDQKNTVEVVVRHGNYDCFPNSMSRSEARKILGIPNDTLTVTSVGVIRSEAEYQLLKRFTAALKKHSGILLQLGSINPPNGFLKRHFKRNNLIFKKRFKHCGSFVEDNKMQIYLNACDLLLIPRVESLNSGNVALGFTFGKLVMGPDYGVIGEELKATGNPVFKSISQRTINETLELAVSLLDSDISKNNRNFAMNELNWDKLADEYISLYDRLSIPSISPGLVKHS